jgi:hypothetical protein
MEAKQLTIVCSAAAQAMKTLTTNLVHHIFGIFLLGAAASAAAQTTWNYFISDAGDGNSLVTWNVTGSLATSPGAVLVVSESSLAVSIVAPGIYADTYLADGTPQSLPTPGLSSVTRLPPIRVEESRVK